MTANPTVDELQSLAKKYAASSRETVESLVHGKRDLATQFDHEAGMCRARANLCRDRGNMEQAEYNLGRAEALRWAASLVRGESKP